MFVDILALRVKVLGCDHPDTLRSRSSLANSLFQLGLFSESAEMHEEIIKDRVRVMGANHPRTELSRIRLEAVLQAAESA